MLQFAVRFQNLRDAGCITRRCCFQKMFFTFNSPVKTPSWVSFWVLIAQFLAIAVGDPSIQTMSHQNVQHWDYKLLRIKNFITANYIELLSIPFFSPWKPTTSLILSCEIELGTKINLCHFNMFISSRLFPWVQNVFLSQLGPSIGRPSIRIPGRSAEILVFWPMSL